MLISVFPDGMLPLRTKVITWIKIEIACVSDIAVLQQCSLCTKDPTSPEMLWKTS